jgi:hypothetical protein
MTHYKSAKRDAWQEIQGEDDTPAAPLRPQLQVLMDLENDPGGFLDRADAFLQSLRIGAGSGQERTTNQDSGTHNPEALLVVGQDPQEPMQGTQNHCENIRSYEQNPHGAPDIHVSGIVAEEVQPADTNVRVESAPRRGRGRPPKRKRGRVGS